MVKKYFQPYCLILNSLFKKYIPTEITSPGIRISHIKNNYYYKGMLPCFFGGLL